MFIKTGKSIFGNTGLIISLCILLILLYFSYNKCYNNNYNSDTMFESFICETGKEPDCSTLPVPNNVRIAINGTSVSLKFSLTNTTGLPTPSQFIVVLAQYDSTKKNTGNNKFYVSNEYEITSSVIATTENYKTNLCSFVSGLPSCNYMFSNIDINDENGKLFYYKLGVSAIYENYNTQFVMPYNVNSPDKLFTVGASTEVQNQQYNDFISYQSSLNDKNTSGASNPYTQTISTADGQYELIKSQLGNYPNNLVLNDQTTNSSTLSDLIDKNMALGILNINVGLNTALPTKQSGIINANGNYIPSGASSGSRGGSGASSGSRGGSGASSGSRGGSGSGAGSGAGSNNDYDTDEGNISSSGNSSIDFHSPIPIPKSLDLATPFY
jgi:hypothetical protein